MIYLINNTGNTIALNLGVSISGGSYSLKLVSDTETYILSGLTDTSSYPERYSYFTGINISMEGTGWYDYTVYNSGNTILDKGLSFVKFNEVSVKEYTNTKNVKTYKK